MPVVKFSWTFFPNTYVTPWVFNGSKECTFLHTIYKQADRRATHWGEKQQQHCLGYICSHGSHSQSSGLKRDLRCFSQASRLTMPPNVSRETGKETASNAIVAILVGIMTNPNIRQSLCPSPCLSKKMQKMTRFVYNVNFLDFWGQNWKPFQKKTLSNAFITPSLTNKLRATVQPPQSQCSSWAHLVVQDPGFPLIPVTPSRWEGSSWPHWAAAASCLTHTHMHESELNSSQHTENGLWNCMLTSGRPMSRSFSVKSWRCGAFTYTHHLWRKRAIAAKHFSFFFFFKA